MKPAGLKRGFTLVELLVAMALLSLVMLGLLTAMRSFAQTETRIDDRIRSDEDLRVTEQFLRAIMATVSPRVRAGIPGAPRQIDFAGSADVLRWIGVMPARHGAGGLYRFRLFVRPVTAEASASLVLEFAPYVPGFDAPLDPAAVQSRVMAGGIGAVSFRYQDDLRSGEQWVADWHHTDRLPRRIALGVLAAGRRWPEIVVGAVPVVGPGTTARGGGLTSGSTIGPF
jgi:general secretion pathway protein J